MADKIKKFLSSLPDREFHVVTEIIDKIIHDNLAGLNVKKLRGESNIFRVKKGDVRIIFSRNNNINDIISAGRRNEKTYRDF